MFSNMADSVPARGNVLGSLIPARYILAILGSIAMSIIYGLKVNLSVAMVAMLDHSAIRKLSEQTTEAPTTMESISAVSESINTVKQHMISVMENITAVMENDDVEEACQASNSTKILPDGPFSWEPPLQGLILSCYFWGYLVSQFPGARIAEMFSAKWVMFFSVAINIVCTLLTPVMAVYYDYVGLMAMRIGEGIGGGVTFPAMHVMLASWAPPNERSMMSSIVYAGTSLGTVISMLMAGILAGNWCWESVFYIMGGLSLIWTVLWIWLVQDTPNKQPLISDEERMLITSSLSTADSQEKTKPKMVVPWSKVATSLPFYAILIAHVCSNFGWYMLLIELPFYMKQVLKFEIQDNAIATAVPFLTMWFFSMIISRTLDYLRQKGKINTTIARKIATLFASVVPMVCLLILCFIGCRRILAVIVVGIGVTSIGGMFCGFLSNHIDIAPNFAGTLMALTNTAATIGGILVPIFVGFVTKGDETIGAWRIVFFVTIVLYVIEIVVYTIFGSGEEQPWNRIEEWHSIDEISKSCEEATPLKQADGEQTNSYTVNK